MTAAPPAWEAVRDQPAAVELLRGAVQRDAVAHAWLFVGPAGVGQSAAARALAAGLNCLAETPGARPCGRCERCRALLDPSVGHPTLVEFRPQGREHVVDDVREQWIPTAALTLRDGRRRVVRVVDADRMNEAAQNAFLKLLEEPPPSTVWVLDAADAGELLETIVSRCRRVDFAPWGLEALTDHAVETLGVEPARARVLARAAMGDPTRLRALSDVDVETMVGRRRAERDANPRRTKPTDEELDAQRRAASAGAGRELHLDVVRRLVDEGPRAATALAAEVEAWAKAREEVRESVNADELDRLARQFGGDPETGQEPGWPPGVKRRLEARFRRERRDERFRALSQLLDDLGAYLRDLLALAEGGDDGALVNLDRAGAAVADARAVPVAVLLDGLAAVGECRDALERNGQPRLQLERLFIRLTVGLAGTR